MKKFENKIIYQIYPKSFRDTTGNGIGDINGIIEKLDYLKELGVDYIWLSPICVSPQKDNGYDISDYYNIDSMFGSKEDYYNLISEAKKRNIKVMMDLVLNHTSDEHIWFKKALEKDEKYYNYYIFRDEPNDIKSYFGGSAWEYSEKVDKYYFRLFDKSQPDLNWKNPEVRADIYKMVNYWIDKGVEGFRLDVIDLIGKDPDNNVLGRSPMFYEYLKELNENTFKDKLLTVGECWYSNLEESNKMCNSKGLTQAFTFNHLGLVDTDDKWIKQKLDLNKLVEVLEFWENEYSGINAQVMNNHDLPRLISTWLNDSEYRVESAKMLITLFGLLKGNLYIYQGEEFGSTNAYMNDISDYRDVETLNKYDELREMGFDEKVTMSFIKKTSRDNARVPMQWNSKENAGFTKGKPWLKINENYKEINVETDFKSENSIFEYYKNIIRFRKDHYNLIDTKVEFEVEGEIIKFKRGNINFVGNFSEYAYKLNKKEKPKFSNYKEENKKYIRPYEVYVIIN